MNEKEETAKIEYEQITLSIPKKILELLKNYECVTGSTPKEWLEYTLVDSVRSAIDGGVFTPSAKWQADNFSLNPIFKEITGAVVV